jgi:hypothetical protein
MRYTRFKRKRTNKRYAAFFLISLLIIAIIYIASVGTIGKFISGIISPILASFDKGEANMTDEQGESDEPSLAIPDNNVAENAIKITDTIETSPMSICAIQMGAFTDETNAISFGDMIKSKGAAGYVMEDNFYRVLAMGYLAEEDARIVREQLKDDGIESHIYKISAPGVKMQISATEANVNAIKDAFATWEEKFKGMEDVIFKLDKGQISTVDAYDTIEAYNITMTDIYNELAGLAANQENNAILDGLAGLYSSTSSALSDIMELNSSDKVAFSSKIKYTYIDMLMKYKQYMEKITGS